METLIIKYDMGVLGFTLEKVDKNGNVNMVMNRVEASKLAGTISQMANASTGLEKIYFRGNKQMISPKVMNELNEFDYNGLSIEFV